MRNLLLLGLSLLTLSLSAQTDAQLAEKSITKQQIEGTIGFLADDLLKGRETGTPELKIAASYLANALKSYGVMPNPETGNYYQAVPMERRNPPKNLSLKIGESTLDQAVMLRSGAAAYNGDMVYMGYGLEDDYANANVKGKVVVVKAGSETAQDARAAFGLGEQKMALAQKNGAIALVELLNAADQMWGFIDHQFNAPSVGLASDEEEAADFPFVWVQDSNGAFASSLSPYGTTKGSLNIVPAAKELFDSYNVVGWVEGSDAKLKDEFIIYSGHYDHVGVGTPDAKGDTIYNGARDNAVGVTTVLTMAKNLTQHPTKRSGLFILFTGEEKGLLGSNYYVKNPMLPLKQMVYCFNSDNAGYNDTSLATIIGLPRTTAGDHIKNACKQFGLTAVDDPAPEQGLFDRSDNVHFAKAGIPAPTFSLGFTAFNGTVTEYYHRPGDEAHTLDYDYLEKFFKAYVLAGRLIGNDPKTPVWTAGDKYEEASKALYKN
ncbi:MAG: M28 family peptidase [Gilvibacter sp.]